MILRLGNSIKKKRGIPSVAGVFLKGKAEYGDALVVERVEHARDDFVRESFLLVVVDLEHLVPVLGDLFEIQRLAQVDEHVDVLLEARASETNTRLFCFKIIFYLLVDL